MARVPNSVFFFWLVSAIFVIVGDNSAAITMMEPLFGNWIHYATSTHSGNGTSFVRDCGSANGVTICSTPGYTVQFPTPLGWRDFSTNTPNYHFYNTLVGADSSDPQRLQQAIAEKPTPGSQHPATSQGTLNDAIPIIGGIIPVDRVNLCPVMSFTTTNQLNGHPVVVNVTLPGHPLFPGIVVREVESLRGGTIVHNFGEGTSELQSPDTERGKIIGPLINSIWRYITPSVPQRAFDPAR
jgi:hypothetical protein